MALFRNVLIADDEPSIRHVLTLALTEAGYDVRAVADGEEALAELNARAYDVVVSDVRMPKVDGLTLLGRALEKYPELTFIVMSAYGSQDDALSAVAKGAWDFVQKPFKPQELLFVLRKAEERSRLIRENQRLRSATSGDATSLERLQGVSDAIVQVRKQVEKLAPVPTTVLITGESGTGKELVARALHDLSPRKGMPFVAVNCGAIPAGLIESELFGHARGAFTDARTAKRGLFTEADGGTLFLDEVGELPVELQPRLLRVIESGTVKRLGEDKPREVNVRIIAATHRDLQAEVKKGTFREDLYFRLAVVLIRVPPLRERIEDIPLLARQFVATIGRGDFELPSELREKLAQHSWPGNVRELRNVVERALAGGDVELGPADAKKGVSPLSPDLSGMPFKDAKEKLVDAFTLQYLVTLLDRCDGNISEVARTAGIGRNYVHRLVNKYGLRGHD